MKFLAFLGFDRTKHSVRTEILAGVTTFLSMAYILAVNPSIFAPLAEKGMPSGAVFTATALAAIVGTLLMSVYAKLPYGLAPGMGLNAFFVYTICMTMGYSWQFALTAVFLEGIIFILLSIFKLRELILDAIPESLKAAIACGIGLFIAFVGLQNAGVVIKNEATIVGLGDISSPPVLLFFLGLFTIVLMEHFKIRGGMLLTIVLVTFLGIPFGITHIDGLISPPESFAPICMQFEWEHIFTPDMAIVLFTLLFMDMFDTIGTLMAVSTNPEMKDDKGEPKNLGQAFMCDAIATTAGACLGINTTTTFMESATGVEEGGRTGVTSLVIALGFIVALFFSPLFLAIPAVATAPALVAVGMMMTRATKTIDFGNPTEALPCFLCIISMPLAYSISEGISFGVISYAILNTLAGKHKQISVTMYVLTALFIARYIFL